jgi:hypothetical protein
VLNNELYVGRYVWNRSKWIKNPDTGKRERFIRPESEWQSVARPAVCGRIEASYGDADRIVLAHVRAALCAPDVATWIEKEALRRAAELTNANRVSNDLRARSSG